MIQCCRNLTLNILGIILAIWIIWIIIIEITRMDKLRSEFRIRASNYIWILRWLIFLPLVDVLYKQFTIRVVWIFKFLKRVTIVGFEGKIISVVLCIFYKSAILTILIIYYFIFASLGLAISLYFNLVFFPSYLWANPFSPFYLLKGPSSLWSRLWCML